MTNKIQLSAKTLGIYVGQDPQSFITTRVQQVKVTFAGFEGDKHSGLTHLSGGRTPHYPRGTEIRNDRQLTIVSIEELSQVAKAMSLPEILPEWLGANLFIQGIPNLAYLPIGTRLFFANGVTLVAEGENNPCTGPGRVIQQHYGRPGLETLFTKAALHQRGVVAMVEKPGFIQEGEEFQAQVSEQVIYNVE